MKNFKWNNKKFIIWIVWVTLVILWNYGLPTAKPFYDVAFALLLSLIFMTIKNTSIQIKTDSEGRLLLAAVYSVYKI